MAFQPSIGSVRKVGNVWLPEDEKDPVMLSGGAKYQGSKLAVALHYVKDKTLALDVGAHCGLWTMQLANHFSFVECFEPLPVHIKCWKMNVTSPGCSLHEVAIGDRAGRCGIEYNSDYSGRSYVKDGGDYPIVTLDQYGFDDVGLIKIDVEGYEYHVVAGAKETLKRCKPAVIVEQKPGHASRFGFGDTSAVALLEELGAKVRKEVVGDYIMSWE